jgi:subtilisin family serine protease
MEGIKVMAAFSLFLFLLIYLVKPGFGEVNNYDSLAIQKIDSSLLNSKGETSAIIEFSKKPSNYKQVIRSLGGRIVHDYNNMESVSVKIDGKNVSKLASLGNLIRVYEDKKVKALLHDSAPLIYADQVWIEGFTGKDVKVCVVDTGVDYTHAALGSCSPLITNGNVESYILQSSHPYQASYNHTWTITKPGYTKISVHFVNISLDNGYDFIYIKDKDNNIVQSFTGNYKDVWSVSVPGDTIKINLVSDWYMCLYGFYIDKVINGSVSFGFDNCKKVIAGYDFVNNDNDPMDDNNHGTHVAGIISSDNSYSRGIANGTKIMAAKVLDANGEGSDSNAMAGIDWCISNGAKIISMSLGGSDNYTGTCDDEVLSQAVNSAVDNGVFVIVAAGNSGQYGLNPPACASKALAVGAVDKNKSVVGFSSKGSELDIVAPGYTINSTLPNNKWNKFSGTSMAAPHVSGVAALMLEANSSLSFADVKRILSQTSDPVNKCYECTWSNGQCTNNYGTEIPCTPDVVGSGIVNAFRTVNYVSSYPQYYNVVEPGDPSVYSPSKSYLFSTNWIGSIDKVVFEFNGTNYTDTIKNGNLYSKTLQDLPAGTYNYEWYANDTSGKWNSTDLLDFTVAKATPDVSLLLNNSEADIAINKGSSINITSVLNNGEGSINLYENDSLVQSGKTISVIRRYDTVSFYNINASCAETQNYTSYFKTHTVNVKDTPLIITLLSPQNTTYTTNSVSLTFTINKPASWIVYSLDGQSNVTITANTTLTGFANGVHNIIVYSNDSANNVNSSSKIYFTISVPVCTCGLWTKVDSFDQTDCRYGYCTVCTTIFYTRNCNPTGCSQTSRRTKACQ